MEKIKVIGTSFFRDPTSKVLFNMDQREKDSYFTRVNSILSEKEEINKVKSELENVQKDMREIKDLLLKLSEKG